MFGSLCSETFVWELCLGTFVEKLLFGSFLLGTCVCELGILRLGGSGQSSWGNRSPAPGGIGWRARGNRSPAYGGIGRSVVESTPLRVRTLVGEPS